MERYIGDILLDCRRDSKSIDVPSPDWPGAATTFQGKYTQDLLRWANYGQERLQGLILKKYPFAFTAQKEISLVANQAEYSIPDNLYLGTRITYVEYSPTGETRDYYPLFPKDPYTRITNPSAPYAYHRRNGQVVLEPPPSTATGKIRVTYERGFDRLDLRRGRIKTVTAPGTPPVVSAIAIYDTDDDSSALTAVLASKGVYLSISSPYGVPLCYAIPCSAQTAGSGVVNLAITATTCEAAATAANLVESYITIGQYSTTHSKLPNETERYLVEYVNRRAFKRDSSDDAKVISEEMKDMEKELVDSYEVPDKTRKTIPIADYELFQLPSWAGRD